MTSYYILENENLTEKVQVLLGKSTLQSLNFFIFRKAFLNNEKAMSVSSYIRDVIEEHIKNQSDEQLSYAQVQVQKAFDSTKINNKQEKEDGQKRDGKKGRGDNQEAGSRGHNETENIVGNGD